MIATAHRRYRGHRGYDGTNWLARKILVVQVDERLAGSAIIVGSYEDLALLHDLEQRASRVVLRP